jgi:hypothetical protein
MHDEEERILIDERKKEGHTLGVGALVSTTSLLLETIE